MTRQPQAMILDLDDTIFRTKSMPEAVFEPFFQHLAKSLQSDFQAPVIDKIVSDLWQNTWDKVIIKYKIPPAVLLSAIKILDNLELNLKIATYPDYDFIKKLPHLKFLVTTSLTSLQNAKIRALKIENDFTEIIINDTFKESKSKLDIFKELVHRYQLIPENTLVIGDNPDSEIAAGNQLHMITVQIMREGVLKGNNAKHYIHSFDELGWLLEG